MRKKKVAICFKYEKVLEESWEKTKAEDRVARQKMEREEAQCITQQKEEAAKKEVEQIEAQLKPLAEAREKCYAQRKETGKPPLLPKIPDDEWMKIVEQWPCGPRRQSMSESEETDRRMMILH